MGSSVDNAKSQLLQAESRLRCAKDSNGKLGTVYDSNVEAAQQEVKRCKANLAAAKKK